MVTTKSMNQNIRRQSVMGLRDPPTGDNIRIEDLPKAVQERLAKSSITDEEFYEMLYFAKFQPRGKRRLNKKDLTDLVVGFGEAPLTNKSGLRNGGKVSKTILDGSIDPLKAKSFIANIKNKNRIPTNPNYSSFKNSLKI